MGRTNPYRRWLFAATALACLTGGCAPSSNTPASPPAHDAVPPEKVNATDERRARETSGGTYFVSYTPVPSPVPLNKIFELDVRVFTDAAMTTPADGVTIAADAAMPHHHHGMNIVPRAERAGPGQFRVTGMLFHMPGYWEIYVDVKAGGRDERARFEVVIK
jgi:hypothetical protein